MLGIHLRLPGSIILKNIKQLSIEMTMIHKHFYICIYDSVLRSENLVCFFMGFDLPNSRVLRR